MRATTFACVASFSISLTACHEPEPVAYTAPVQSRAGIVLEPPELRVGEVATLEVVVSTPANHHVRPFAMPDEVPGLWILETETLETAREPNRWIHRTLVRIRAREVGRFAWPAARIDVDVPDGDVQTLVLDPVEIAVHSVFPNYAGQLSPFGVEPLPGRRATTRGWLWAVGGAGFSLACVALVALARRQSQLSAQAAAVRPAARGIAPWDAALAEIASVAQSHADGLTACQHTSIALRRYMQRRFGADVMARTTEELEHATPPFAATSRWPRFIALLRRLDDLRFPAPLSEAEQAALAREILADSDAFVRDTIPIESAR